jgi:hypothetical protein
MEGGWVGGKTQGQFRFFDLKRTELLIKPHSLFKSTCDVGEITNWTVKWDEVVSSPDLVTQKMINTKISELREEKLSRTRSVESSETISDPKDDGSSARHGRKKKKRLPTLPESPCTAIMTSRQSEACSWKLDRQGLSCW